jgi:hypothetical protein
MPIKLLPNRTQTDAAVTAWVVTPEHSLIIARYAVADHEHVRPEEGFILEPHRS